MTLAIYSSYIVNRNKPSNSHIIVPPTLDLYVDDVDYFSTNDAVEAKFECILSKLINVDFMGMVEYVCGTHFSCQITNSNVSVHLNQAIFATNLVE